MTTKSKKSTAVALTVKNVPALIEKIDAELEELQNGTQGGYNTQGNLSGFGNIHNETDISNLIKAHSMITGKAAAYAKSAQALKRTTFPVFQQDGATEEQWINDIEKRIGIVTHQERIDKLNKGKSILKKYMSEEQRMVSDLQEVKGLFS